MIGFIKWLRRDRDSHTELPDPSELQAQYDEATQHAAEAREARKQAERTGSRMRMTLEENHLGERFELALHPRGWEPR